MASRIRLSEIAKQILVRAGWNEGRCVDTTEYEQAIIAAGLPLLPTVVVFLGRFGGLRVDFNVSRGGNDWFVSDPIMTIEGISSEWIEYYNECVGKRLCPIGQAHRNHATLLMAEDGSVYGGYDEEFWEEGKTGIEAIENILAHNGYRDWK